MRTMEFKMERTGLLSVGEVLPVEEFKLPSSYYYVLGRSYAMSREGKVIDVKETEKGFFVTVEFNED